jgi:hypothetical protein
MIGHRPRRLFTHVHAVTRLRIFDASPTSMPLRVPDH